MRENNVTVDRNVDEFSGDTVPECFKILLSTADDETLQNFLVRAEFFRKKYFGIDKSEYIGLLVRDSLYDIGLETIPKLFTGPLINIVLAFNEKYLSPDYFSQKTGETSPLTQQLNKLKEQYKKINEKIAPLAAKDGLPELTLPGMENVVPQDTTQTNVPQDTTQTITGR
jgi:hypothetical protein